MNKLLAIQKKDDIPKAFRETPISDLLLYHNSKTPHQTYEQAKLLIGTCMDPRIKLNISENFAFILRAGGRQFT